LAIGAAMSQQIKQTMVRNGCMGGWARRIHCGVIIQILLCCLDDRNAHCMGESLILLIFLTLAGARQLIELMIWEDAAQIGVLDAPLCHS
tara:strand:+ start:1246 stop:1515 length:270 start_codon:yes stop_codon:yes gene_type:complete